MRGPGQNSAAALGKSEAFRTRMEAQCEEIQRYRHKLKQEEGRELSLEQAAREWVEKYADAFARDNDPSQATR